jgi:proton-dependent oligopeptide transporter, POT family
MRPLQSRVGGQSAMEGVTRFLRSLREYRGSFWAANLSELFERIAFYGMTTILVLFLTKARGLPDSVAIVVGGYFGLFTYGLAAFSGFLADALGYRRAMLIAYALLAVGYALTVTVQGMVPILGSLFLVAFGASLIKPSITGTVQKVCTEPQRPMGFSIYYMLVNVGGFIGPNLGGQIRDRIGVEPVFYCSAIAAGIAFLLVLLTFHEPVTRAAGEERKSFGAFLGDFGRVLLNGRLMLLILLITGFWSMFFQFYGPLPLYLTNDLHVSSASLGFVISLDALAVVCLQVVVGYLVQSMHPGRALFIAALVAAAGIAVIGLVPSIWVVGAGILVFSVGEMIYSAHFYRYLGSIAPSDQVGMYMGFAFLPIALGYFAAGLIGSWAYPFFKDTLHQPQLMWFLFAGVGVVSAFGLLLMTALIKPAAAASPAEGAA